MRVTSQQLRQFVVVQDGVLDPYILAENVALFNADGTPLEGLEESTDARALVWRGPWVEGTEYSKFDLVSYDPGSDPAIYIFNENVSGSNYLFETYPLDALLTEDLFPVSMVIDESISRSDNLSGSDNPFRAYGIKIAEAGQLHLSTAPVGAPRDMMAVLFRLDADGVTWIPVASGDDEAGSLHPAINTAVTPGTYLFAFTILGGDDPDAYGTSTLTLGGSNTAVLGTWDAASFPVDSVTRFVAESGGSRLPPGGAVGEFLAKVSATDGDADWVPAPTDGGDGSAGSGAINFRGEWSDTITDYDKGDLVRYEGALWLAPAPIATAPGEAAALICTTDGVDVYETDRAYGVQEWVTNTNSDLYGTSPARGMYIPASLGVSVHIKISNPLGSGRLLYFAVHTADSFYAGPNGDVVAGEDHEFDLPSVGYARVVLMNYAVGYGSWTTETTPTDVLTVPGVEWELVLEGEDGTGGGALGLVSALPGTPTDGDEILFQNSEMEALGIAWHLKYRDDSTSDFKWEFAGGGPLYLWDDVQQAHTTNATYQYIGSEQMVVPLDGEYEFAMSSDFALNDAGSAFYTANGLAIDGVVNPGMEYVRFGNVTPAFGHTHGAFSGRVLEVAAGDIVRPMHNGTSGDFYANFIRATMRPIRVG